MIIWLASYPKSGNTWIRSIISSILFSNDGKLNNFELLNTIDQYPTRKYFDNLVSDYNDPIQIQKSWIPSQELINLDKNIKFFKTHHIYCKYGDNAFTNESNTLGVIHIVRDPRNLISSLKYHWSLKDDYDAMEKLLDIQTATGIKIEEKKNYSFPVMISSWKNHYNAWKSIKKNYLLVKYEDLVNDPENQLIILINYLKNLSKFEINDDKIKNILESTSFENFKKLEKEGLFEESNLDKTGQKKSFFNEGPNKKWENSLKKEISDKIEKEFFNEMKELGYLK